MTDLSGRETLVRVTGNQHVFVIVVLRMCYYLLHLCAKECIDEQRMSYIALYLLFQVYQKGTLDHRISYCFCNNIASTAIDETPATGYLLKMYAMRRWHEGES